jgi:DNA-directed RNA polymerase subunit beta
VLSFEDGNAWVKVHPEASVGAKVADDVKPPRHREPDRHRRQGAQRKLVEKLIEGGVEKIPVRAEALVGRRTATPHRGHRERRGAGRHQHRADLAGAHAGDEPPGGARSSCLVVAAGKIDASMYETLARDHVKNPDEALVEIYRKLRPGDPPTVESARALFRGMFMDARRYDLARVGRFMINKKLLIDAPLSNKTLRSEDIVSVIRHLLMVKLGSKPPTTSTTSATAGCAPSASCWRTSSGSASRGWSARSRNGCRSPTSRT